MALHSVSQTPRRDATLLMYIVTYGVKKNQDSFLKRFAEPESNTTRNRNSFQKYA
jgi:hypothetical protein